MPPSPAQATPLPGTHGAIAPHQLWAQLTRGQQQRLRQALIAVGRQLLDNHPNPPTTQELSDER
jgi:hypothetical protein